jgi:fibronectin-binding autotransporter adhesin
MKSQSRCRAGVRSAARKLDLACQRTLKTLLAAGRFWPLAAPAGGLIFAPSAMGQTSTTYKPTLSDIQIVQNAGVGDPNAGAVYINVPGVAGAPPPGYTASPYPILTTSLVTATYQLVNTFTNQGPPSTTAYGSIGEANSTTDVSVDLGTGTGVTQTNPGGAYGHASELSFNVNTLAFFVSPDTFFPANHAPEMIYQFGIGGTLPAFGSADFGVSLSFYFYQTSNTASFSFSNTNITGTKLASISMSELFTNSTSKALAYTNLGSPSLYSGSALLANSQLLTVPGYIDVVGSINMEASVDGDPGGSGQNQGLSSTTNGNWAPSPSSFSMYMPQQSFVTDAPGAGNTFDVTGSADLAQSASWTDVTSGGGAPVLGPPGSLDVAQFYSGIIAKATTFSFSSAASWGGLSVVNPGAAVIINSGVNTLTIGGLGIGISSDTNGFSQNLTIASPTILGASQIWDVVGGQTLTFSGSTLNLGGNVANLQDNGNYVISSNISGGGSGGGFMMNSMGTLFLSGNNSFSGGILLNSGEVSVASDANLGGMGSGLTFNGGILQVTGTTLTNLNNHVFNSDSFTGGFDIVSPNNTFTISQSLRNSAVTGGNLTKLGAGTLTLSGSNTFYGTTNIDNGVLRVAGTGSLSSLSTVNINTPQGLVLSNGVTVGSPVNVNVSSVEFINLPDANETATLSGSITENPNDNYDLGFPNQSALLYVTGATTVAPAAGITIGEGNVTFAGNGSLIANTADVPISIGGGAAPVNLTLQDNSTITDTSIHGSLNFNSSGSTITVSDHASLNLGPGDFAYFYAGPGTSTLNLNGGTMVAGSISEFGGSMLLKFNGGVLELGGQVTGDYIQDIAPGSTILSAPSAGIGMAIDTNGFETGIYETAGLTGSGGLTKLGAGELYLDNTFADATPAGGGYTGATTVYGGILEFGALAGEGGPGQFDGTPYMQVLPGGAIGVDSGSTSNGELLGKLKTAPSEAGGFALAASDSAVAIDYTGTVAGAFNMKNAGGANISNMSIGAVLDDQGGGGTPTPVVFTGTITPATTGTYANTYLLGGGGTLELATVTSGGNAGTGIPLVDNSGLSSNVLIENGGAVFLPTLNTYTGTTTIAGTMVLANPNTSSYQLEQTTLQVNNLADGASSIGNSSNVAANLVINGGVLQYLGSGDTSTRLFTIGQYGATLDSSGAAGALTLSNDGSEAFSAGAMGAVTLTLTGSNTAANALDAALGNPAGGQLSLVKSGPGFWELSGDNTFTGGTYLDGGTLEISSLQNIGGAAGAITFNGGTLQLASASIPTLDNNSVNWSTFNGGISLGGGTFTISESLQGSGTFTLLGSGNLVLGGADNTISGGVEIDGGTLTFSNFSQLGTANIDDYGTLQANLTAPAVFSGNIDGTGNFVQAAGTSLTLNGNNSYAGTTTVGNGATLVLDYSSAGDPFASILGGGSGLTLGGGTLQVNPNSFLAVSQTFASTTFTAGPSAITLNTSTVGAITVNLGAIIRYPGATVEFNAPTSGTVSGLVTSSGSGSAQLLAMPAGGTEEGYATFGASDWAATTAASGGESFIVPASAISGFYTALTSGSAYASTSNLNLTGTSGQILMNGVTAASMRFNLPNGGSGNFDGNNMDQVDIASTLDVGAFLMTPNVASNDLLITPNNGGSNQHTQDIVVSGGDAVFWQNDPGGLLILNTGISANSLIKQGPGAMAINATSTYTGTTYIDGGILEVPYDAALGSGPPYAGIALDGGSLMAVQFMSTGRNITLGSQGGGLLAAPGFTETINNGISGLGGLSLGSNGAVPIAPVNAGNNSVTTSSVNATGTVALMGDNTYQGPTDVLSGLLRLGNASALGSTSALNVNSGATLDMNGFSLTVPSLSGGGTLDQITSNSAVNLVVDGSASTVFSGVIKNTDGEVALKIEGTGTLTLTGNNTFGGGTTILGGELSISSQANDSGAISINGGALQITGTSLTSLNTASFFSGGLDIANSANLFTVSETIAGGGSLEKLGAGTLDLTASNTYTGGTTILAGTLLAASPASLGSGPVVDDGVLLFTNPGTVTVTQNISGSGGLTSSQQNLVLAGNNTYIATTTINAGDALTVASGATLPMNGEVINNGTLTLNNANTSLGGVSGSGTMNVSNTSTVYASGFTQASLVNNGNTTIGCGGTVGSITGSGALTLGTDTMVGQLQLTGSGVVNQQSGLTIVAGSQLDLTKNSFLISYGAPANDPVLSIVAALTSGYNSDTWTGTGIVSSNAAANPGKLSVGYIDGNNDPGEGVGANQLLIKFTVAGDANLDGTVNFADLLIVAQNFNKTGEDWAHGNFIYMPSGLVNFADLLLVAQNFNENVSSFDEGIPSGGVPLVEPIPEPSAAGLIVAAGAGLLARRRRRARTA